MTLTVGEVTLSDGEVTLTDGVYSYQMDGLLPCVEYMVIVVAYIEGVVGEKNGSVVFTTLPQGLLLLLLLLLLLFIIGVDIYLYIAITAAPTQLEDQSIGTRHMLLSWPMVPTTSCPSYPITYTVLYQSTEPATNIKGELELQIVTENILGNGLMFVVLSNLEEFYNYNVTVFASNQNGNGPVISSFFKTLPTGMLLLFIYVSMIVPVSTPSHTNMTRNPFNKHNHKPLLTVHGLWENFVEFLV